MAQITKVRKLHVHLIANQLSALLESLPRAFPDKDRATEEAKVQSVNHEGSEAADVGDTRVSNLTEYRPPGPAGVRPK